MFWGYAHEDDLPRLLSQFVDECEKLGIDQNSTIVLTRGKEFLNKVVPGSVQRYGLIPWRDNDHFTRGITKSKYLFDKGKFRDAFHILEREICKCRVGKSVYHPTDLETAMSGVGFENWRAGLYEFLTALPKTDCALSEWIPKANAETRKRALVTDSKMSIKRNSQRCRYSELTFEEVFATLDDYAGDTTCPLGTVHSVKGKTFEGVLLVLKKRDGNSRYYTNLIDCEIQEHEELRILYVAVTRPRKLLVLAVPDDHLENWERKFAGSAA